MSYIKNHESWSASDKLTTSKLDNFETQYSEISTYLGTHNHNSDYYLKTEMDSTFFGTHNDGPGSGSDADLIYHADGNMEGSEFAGLGIPVGLIILWPEETVPSGWHICDGTSGTVDMRDVFPVCAGSTSEYSVGDTGNGTHAPQGTINIASHALTTAEVAGHQHSYVDKYGAAGAGAGYYQEGTGSRHPTLTYNVRNTDNSNVGKTPADGHDHEASFTGNNFNILPKYFSLKYIQKLAS